MVKWNKAFHIKCFGSITLPEEEENTLSMDLVKKHELGPPLPFGLQLAAIYTMSAEVYSLCQFLIDAGHKACNWLLLIYSIVETVDTNEHRILQLKFLNR